MHTNSGDNNNGNKNFILNETPIYDADFNDINENGPKKKRNVGKWFAIVALIVAITIGGGAIGSTITYNLMSENKAKTITYTPPVFQSTGDETALTVAEAYEKVKPAVVTVSTKGLAAFNGMYNQPTEGIGSGFIINEEGYILTNYHVIEGAQGITITLSDGTEANASVINYDQDRDIAMLKLAEGTKVPAYAELGDSDELYTGQDVLAIGTPLSKDFAQTATKGIVSAINRDVESSTGTVMNLIQTDTAINPGNSGGPLINTKGQVIGINSMKISAEGVQGIGFAIPINDAKDRIDALSKPILNLGITVREITEEMSKQVNLPEGIYVVSVNEFSPAEKAGIQNGDMIVGFDGKKINTFQELKDIKDTKSEGDKVEIVVERNGKEIKLNVELTV